MYSQLCVQLSLCRDDLKKDQHLFRVRLVLIDSGRSLLTGGCGSEVVVKIGLAVFGIFQHCLQINIKTNNKHSSFQMIIDNKWICHEKITN
jgi:hypothetical protein